MLAYAANRPRIGARQSSPHAMLFVICAHIVLIAVVMSVKMALPPKPLNPPIDIYQVPILQPPPPTPNRAQPRHESESSNPPLPRPKDPFTAVDPDVPIDFGQAFGPAPSPGAGTSPLPPLPLPLPQPAGVSRDAQLVTPPSELRPPYPQSKLLAEQEASLRLRLTVDENGRVTAVEPVGRADAVFLAAARRHLLAHWRYKPAMKDGRAVASSIVITLRFQLDG